MFLCYSIGTDREPKQKLNQIEKFMKEAQETHVFSKRLLKYEAWSLMHSIRNANHS
jgi:hypothetical protein